MFAFIAEWYAWGCVAVISTLVGRSVLLIWRERAATRDAAEARRLGDWAATLREFNRKDGRTPMASPWKRTGHRHLNNRAEARSVWTLPGITQYHTFRAAPTHARPAQPTRHLVGV